MNYQVHIFKKINPICFKSRSLWLFVLFSLYFPSLFAQTFPAKPNNYVSDLSGKLGTEQAQHLNDTLAYFEQKTSNQIFVLIADTLYGLRLEDATLQIAEKWGVGQKEFDNGVLLAVFLKDRKLRIEVGYGLEAYLTDLAASNIITYYITPRFKENRIYEGIRNGVYQIMARTDSAYVAEMAILSKKRQAEYELKKIKEEAQIKQINQMAHCVYAVLLIGWYFPLFYLLTWIVFGIFQKKFPGRVSSKSVHPRFSSPSDSKLFYQWLGISLGVFSGLLMLDALFFQGAYHFALAVGSFANDREMLLLALSLFVFMLFGYRFVRTRIRKSFENSELIYVILLNFLFSFLLVIPLFIFRYYELRQFIKVVDNYSLYYIEGAIWDTFYWNMILLLMIHFYIYRQPKWWLTLKGGGGGSYTYSSGSSSSSSSWGSSSSSSSWGSSSSSSSSSWGSSSSSSSSSWGSSGSSSGSSSFGGGGGGSFGGGGASGSW